MDKFFARKCSVLILLLSALLMPTRMFGVGWTPTDAGLVVNLEQGHRFLLSVWVDKNGNGTEEDGEEFFVSNYTRYTGGYYDYGSGTYMKLLPAPEITEMNEWSVGAPLNRGNKALGGIAYTIWNDGKTLKTSDSFKFLGDLTDNYADAKACDVVFVIPTERGVPTVDGRPGLSSFDPNGTLGRGKTPFNGRMGTGFLGMTYREVYMLQIPKANSPQSYTNAGLVTFNTTLSTWKLSSGAGDIAKGKAAYAYADSKHDKTPRTIFRLYLLDDPINSCSSYFFATDEEDDVRYRKNENNPQKSSDSTATKTIYTMDRLMCMSRDGSTKYYRTDLMRVPEPDNTYYYVGYDNQYKDDDGESMGTNGAHSLFTNIRELPMKDLSGFNAPAGAYGQMVVDTTSAADNLGVSFEPVGYFLKIKETGKNIRLHKTGDNTWTCEEMWTISGYYASLHIRTMLMTGSEFREDDEGAPVEGWSKWVRGDSVPTSDGKSIVGKSGYAQITVNKTDSNGQMEFILGDNTKWIRYDNNGFMGLEMPLQYPLSGENKVTIMAPRIKSEYTFLGWTKNADGSGDTLNVGDEFTFTEAGEVKLYAQARYDGTFQMAISFIHPTDGKRYFLTHPNTSTPRYAHARHFEHWENTWQGMENAENKDPNYLSTFELRYPVNEIKRKEAGTPDLSIKEHVLDPRRYTMKGYTDSLTFYEYFAPNHDEYLGLYYLRVMNTILANNTWAGLFMTTSDATELSWPNYKVPYIDSTKIKSERYVEEYDPENKKDSLILKERKDGSGSLPAYVQYDPTTDKFNGVTAEADGTDFQISAVLVADEHYIVLPDTTHEWRDSITFSYHQGEQTSEDVWSALIGKQLMAVMFVDGDTIYFHPNRNKIINDPNNLYLSSDFRVTQMFDYIRDSRVSAALNEGDSAKMEATGHYWHYNIVSGLNSPLGVTDARGRYIDVVDTFRITLSQGDISKVKEHRGRWKKGAAGLKVNKDGSRYRDVIVHTKSYHYGDTLTRTALRAEKESYSLGPLKGQTQQLKFFLIRESYRKLLDKDDAEEGEEILSADTIESGWNLVKSECNLIKGSSYFEVNSAEVDKVNISVRNDNAAGVNHDTLVINKIRVGDKDSILTFPARVPLVQTALTGTELIWSAVYNNQRYYLMAGSGGLIARKYKDQNNTLYKDNTTTHLIKGMKDDTNSDKQYITPWKYAYKNPNKVSDTLALSIKLPGGTIKHFCITGSAGSEKGSVGADSSLLIYRYANVYTNDNANYEEQVRLRYGADGWLKLTSASAEGAPTIELTTDSAAGTVFSWGYLHDEYSLLNNGDYPSTESVEFGYNRVTPASVQTLYKAQHEYSMLVDNKIKYLCLREQERIDSLTSASREWKTQYVIDTIRDRRVATLSALDTTINNTTLTTTITPTGTSPMEVMYDGKYVNIVDTLRVTLSLQDGAPTYHFKGDWSKFTKISDATLKIPLIRRTYHEEDYNALVCFAEGDKDVYMFPSAGKNQTHEFVLHTENRTGKQVVNVYGEVAATQSTAVDDLTDQMRLKDKTQAEIRLIDEYGNTPVWCELSDTTDNTVTVKCTADGIRSPRTAYLYFAYIVTVGGQIKFVNYRITITQPSLFVYKNNQHLAHSIGASGDPLRDDGMQQVHENKRTLYYYPEQDVELPVRERAFYGWWRWYREGAAGIGDSDIPDSVWRVAPRNTSSKYNFPFRIIGDSVDDGKGGKKLVTMGRYTVFHYPSKDYGNKNDPPSKSARVAPPITTFGVAEASKPTVTYAVDLSNYYDNLPMSLKDKNNVDIALMDTMTRIVEPTLSIREVFELHPWTEMAEKLDGYKYADGTANGSGTYSRPYMEDHEVMAPIGNRLLLRTEQRYNYENLQKHSHSESLLGYYMRDDNWADWEGDQGRQDSMIWCGGWDADCQWFSYNTMTKVYAKCTHKITSEEDFLEVPARTSISSGQKFDTIYYFLRARSKATTGTKLEDYSDDETVDGAYWFNICRYMIIYHEKGVYGPKEEVTTKGVAKAIINNDSIEQNYEVLERLNFDYNKPGSSYTIYPHPLPWADASYGYTYPETSDLPHNRYHDQSDFPNHGEYGLINRIPYTEYWRKMEQHGGAANGYMIYCDGMASAGQVAALTLNTQLCEGQKMYFSGYVGNCSSQTGKSDPNFIFTVQGSADGSTWEDISSYMTGDIKPSNNWYQIFFPIQHNKKTTYKHFRVRIFNVASSFDGNDFVIDDMCIFATKPPLIAYQAETECVEGVVNDSITQVVLRLDYQGFTDKSYNNTDVYYTVVQWKNGSTDTTFVKMEDDYLNQQIKTGKTTPVVTPDTIFGRIAVPAADFEPRKGIDSIYTHLNNLVDQFEADNTLKQGYIYENLDGVSRPVLYVVHQAKMAANIKYQVHMALTEYDMMRSICAMTSELKVTNRMMLELNGEEQENREVEMCPNSTYALSMRVKGTQNIEGAAPIDIEGSCVNDWLLYGDTVDRTSVIRYGYKYSDIVKVVKEILRANDGANTNRFAQNLSDVNRNVLELMKSRYVDDLSTGVVAYDLLDSLVSKGFLTLYKETLTATVMSGDSLEYVVFPILGTASQAMLDAGIDVCPQPLYIKLKPSGSVDVPLMIGGIDRDSTQSSQPMVILANEQNANKQITLHLDSIATDRTIHSVNLLSTDDPNFVEGLHQLSLTPDRVLGVSASYYKNGDDVILTPAGTSVYHMRPGYNYTFAITMQNLIGETTLPEGCPVGTIPFTVSVVPDYLRWDPKNNESDKWNAPGNWVGVNDANEKIHDNAHFAPLSSSNVIIPTLDAGLPYPVLPASISKKDSVKQIGFEYNKCNVIRFMPGAAMAQQQRMDYNRAVVDMSTPKEKWALRSAPITGMLSGDIFMANDDLDEATSPWEVGYFDANGRNKNTGNASFWLSVYNTATIYKGNGEDVKDSERIAAAEWSKVTNGLTLSLPPASGWAIFTRTTSGKDAAIRLPKNDDIYYYYNRDGDKLDDSYVYGLQALRDTAAGGPGKAGKLAYPNGASQNYTLKNGVASTMFVFGNPTMGYIDIWGFMNDNPGLSREFDYITYTKSDDTGSYITVPESIAVATVDTITEKKRYLPPMHAIVLKATSGTSLTVTLDSSRVVTSARDIVRPSSAPSRMSASGRRQGFMTVTAINPLTSASKSRLLIGQGYHNAVRDGEDALLTTININNYNSSAPSTLFNIYASEGEYGLSVDLLDEIVNVPVSFYNMSGVPFEPVTELWFTGVNNIDGELVFYDALTGSEQTIVDGICIKIPTPEQNHEKRYYIRRRGFDPNDQGTSVATDIDPASHYEMDGVTAVKIIKDGNVLILRDGHVYTMFGQKLR